MSFELSEEHQEFRHSVRDFAEAEIAPARGGVGPQALLPGRGRAEDGRLGLFGLTAPEEYGGVGRRLHQPVRRDRGDLPGRPVDGHHARGGGRARDQPDPHVRHRRAEGSSWLPDLVAGSKLAGFGLTEPESGSDAGATKTRAVARQRRVGDRRLQAVHHQLGFEHHSLVTVTARTGERADGKPEISTIIVPTGTPGFIAEAAYDKLGWHASDTHPLSFSDCRVPEANLLGERGKGFAQFLATLDDGRVAIARGRARLHPGAAWSCRSQYAGERKTFGGPIGRKQGVAFQIADLKVMADAAELLVYRAAALKDAGAPIARVQAGRVASPSCTRPSPRSPRPGSPPRSSAATASWRSTRSPASTATPRSWRSARVPREVQRMLIARGRSASQVE